MLRQLDDEFGRTVRFSADPPDVCAVGCVAWGAGQSSSAPTSLTTPPTLPAPTGECGVEWENYFAQEEDNEWYEGATVPSFFNELKKG